MPLYRINIKSLSLYHYSMLLECSTLSSGCHRPMPQSELDVKPDPRAGRAEGIWQRTSLGLKQVITSDQPHTVGVQMWNIASYAPASTSKSCPGTLQPRNAEMR